MNIQFTRLWRRSVTVLGVLLGIGSVFFSSASAVAQTAANDTKKNASDSSQSATQSIEGAIQNYGADAVLQPGTIVRLADKAAAKVAPVQLGKSSETYGLVVTGTGLPLTVTSSGLPNPLYVALSGTHNVLVSTQNGAIKAGDYVTVSAIDGIGMLAMPGEKVTVIGRAAEDFDGKSNTLGSVQLKSKSGSNAQKVVLGSISLAIDIRDNPKEKSTKANVPPFLEKLGEAIADKQVSPFRIYLSIVITGITVVSALVLLYAGVRNAMTAIGRNPLSKKTIIRTLIEITLTGFIILIIGLFTVYLLLKL